MRVVAGAILVLAGAVLVAAAIIAEAISREPRNVGFYLGGCLNGVGALIMASAVLRRAWDAIPVEERGHSHELR